MNPIERNLPVLNKEFQVKEGEKIKCSLETLSQITDSFFSEIESNPKLNTAEFKETLDYLKLLKLITGSHDSDSQIDSDYKPSCPILFGKADNYLFRFTPKKVMNSAGVLSPQCLVCIKSIDRNFNSRGGISVEYSLITVSPKTLSPTETPKLKKGDVRRIRPNEKKPAEIKTVSQKKTSVIINVYNTGEAVAILTPDDKFKKDSPPVQIKLKPDEVKCKKIIENTLELGIIKTY